MAERDPPSSFSSQPPPPPPPPPPPALPPHISANQNQITVHPILEQTQLELPNFSKGTYVVKVPKDQIYRVPTPENARIAELHRNPPKDNAKRTCICFVVIFVLVAIVVIIAGVIGALFSVLHKHKDPRFSIQRCLLSSTKKTEYEISLQVNNPNSKVGILYKEGGGVSLSLRQQEIASGTYPSFYQAHGNSKVFGITLKGSKSGLLKEVEKSMKNDKTKVHVALSLTINRLPIQMKMGPLHSATMKYDVTCQVTVDTLAKGTRILSQQCQTKRL